MSISLLEEYAASSASHTTDWRQVRAALKGQRIELPSWGFGDAGTRFRVFHQPGAARDIHEKLADAAQVNRFTGVCPTVAIHIPWDKVEDWAALRQGAASLGLGIGAVNPNLFQADAYALGSICHPNAVVRRRAVNHLLECLDIARQLDSHALSLWLADGTNYPGQDDLRARKGSPDRCPDRGLRGPARWHAAADRVQVLRAGLLSHRPG